MAGPTLWGGLKNGININITNIVSPEAILAGVPSIHTQAMDAGLSPCPCIYTAVAATAFSPPFSASFIYTHPLNLLLPNMDPYGGWRQFRRKPFMHQESHYTTLLPCWREIRTQMAQIHPKYTSSPGLNRLANLSGDWIGSVVYCYFPPPQFVSYLNLCAMRPSF